MLLANDTVPLSQRRRESTPQNHSQLMTLRFIWIIGFPHGESCPMVSVDTGGIIDAAGRMSQESGQMQEGLRQELMEASTVSGATDYMTLCQAAKTEGRRLATFRCWKMFTKELPSSHQGWTPGLQTHQESLLLQTQRAHLSKPDREETC